jgi:hypothetical protein
VNLVQPGVVIPPGAHLLGNGTPVISPDVLLRAVRESATIVKPGEVLLIRLPTNMPEQVYVQYAQQVAAVLQQAGIRAVALRADQFAVIDQDAHTVGIRIGDEDEPLSERPESAEAQPAAAWVPSTPPVKYGSSSSPARPEPDQATVDREPYEPGPAG